MLVLTRKRFETIQIGENIVIKVIRTGKGSVKIGIEAPSDIRVLRGEIIEDSTETTNDEDEDADSKLKTLIETALTHVA